MGTRGRGLRAFVLLAVFVSSLFVIPPVSAQDAGDGSLNLTTSPLPINLLAEPGESVTTDLRIKNSGTSVEKLDVGLLKFDSNDTNGLPRLADREEGDDYFDWVTFSENSFVAEPNVWKTIKMTIKIPPTGGLGYYYAATFSRADQVDATENTGVRGGAAILVLLDVRVPGAKRTVELAELKVTKKVYEFLPAEFQVTLNNSGNIHLIPSGDIYISKGGKEIAIIKINNGRGNILPGSTRIYKTEWTDGFPRYEPVLDANGKEIQDEKGNREMSLKWNFGDLGKLRFGKYTATALVVYDDGEKDVPIEAVVSFWVIPWRIIAVGLVILALILFALYTVLRRVFKAGKSLSGKAAKPKHPPKVGKH